MQDAADLPGWLEVAANKAPVWTHQEREAIGSALASVPTPELRRLDMWMRSPHLPWQQWRSLPPDAVVGLRAEEDAIGTVALVSMHPNGRVRAEAVAALADCPTGEEFRWLLLRCLDWVHQVRHGAEAAIRERVFSREDGNYADELADAVTLLEGARFETPQTRDLRSALRDAVLAPSRRDALWGAARTGESRTRRAAIRLLVEVEDPLLLLRRGTTNGDVVATAVVARAALARPDECGEAALLLFRDRNARFREEALWHLLAHGHSDADQLGSALVDPAPGVRAIAQRRLAEDRGDVRVVYRDLLTSGENPGGALLGLGDVGEPRDVSAAARHVTDPRSSIRAAAVRVLARHGAREDISTLIDFALFDSGKVAREAIRGLLRHGATSDVIDRALAAYAANPERRAAQRIYARLAPHARRWDALEYGLVGCKSQQTQDLAIGLLRRVRARWNQSFTSPAVGQLERLHTALSDLDPAIRTLDPKTFDEFRMILASKW